MKRDDATKLVTDGLAMLNEALASGRSETLCRFLKVMSRFHRYSFGNVMLILMQRENATRVAGFHKWKELGRHVRKGENGIAIFAPCRYRKTVEGENGKEEGVHDIRGFKVVHVWDVSQTEGEELPEFAKMHGEPGENLARMELVIRQAGVELEYGPLPLGTDGTCSHAKITVRAELSCAEKLAVLAHEHAHFLLHQKNGRRHECSKTVRETEAEAVAFVVCHAFGIDSVTRSSDYIQLYRGDTETIAESLELIQKTAAGIVQSIRDVNLPCSEMPQGNTPSRTSVEAPAHVQCQHTLHHADAAGNLQGSWKVVEANDAKRVECASCGKFYGRMPKEVSSFNQ